MNNWNERYQIGFDLKFNKRTESEYWRKLQTPILETYVNNIKVVDYFDHSSRNKINTPHVLIINL